MKALAAHPGYSATNLQSHSAGIFGKAFEAGNRLLATDADFGARQTLYAVSQDLPGNSFIGPRFAMRGPHPAESPAARWPATTRRPTGAVGAVRAAHGHQIRALRLGLMRYPALRASRRGWFTATVIDGNPHLMVATLAVPETTTGTGATQWPRLPPRTI